MPYLTRRCPIGGCRAEITAERIMCPTHWRKVPTAIQNEVWEAYSEQKGGPRHIRAVRAALRAAKEVA